MSEVQVRFNPLSESNLGWSDVQNIDELLRFIMMNKQTYVPRIVNNPVKFPCLAKEALELVDNEGRRSVVMCYIYDFEIERVSK